MQTIEALKAAVPNLPEKDQDFARSLLAAASRWRGLTATIIND